MTFPFRDALTDTDEEEDDAPATLFDVRQDFAERTLFEPETDRTMQILHTMVPDEGAIEIEVDLSEPTPGPPDNTEAYVHRTRTRSSGDLSAYESFLLELIADLPKSLVDIERQNVFTERELELGLLTLRSKGLIEVSDSRPPPTPAEHDLEDRTIEQNNFWFENEERPPPAPAPPSSNVRKRLILKRATDAERRDLMSSGLGDGLVRLELAPKAEQLYKAALRDQITGSVLSARMNLKLAIALAPKEAKYLEALEELSASPLQKEDVKNTPAWKKYEEARHAEASGDIDKAIALLKTAIEMLEHGSFYNRLGILLAQKKRELVLAERMLRRALDLDPDNHVYVQNLARVLSALAVERKKADDAGAQN
jgi:tetratricopeptide (TPR) repeat protein